MTKEFVPYEQSLALKELGFDEPCFGVLCEEIKMVRVNDELRNWNDNVRNGETTSAQTFSQCFRWFREKYEWQHSIEPTADQHSHQLGYNYWIWNYKTGEEYHTMPKNRPSGDWEYKTYEEAELECLIKLIEIVKNK